MTQGNAVPPPPIFSRRRSLASNFQKKQGNAKRNAIRYASKHISACCALNFCTVLPFLRLEIQVKDVNVNDWLPDNEVNSVVLGPRPPAGVQGSETVNKGPPTQPPIGGHNLKLHFPHLWISTLTTDDNDSRMTKSPDYNLINYRECASWIRCIRILLSWQSHYRRSGWSAWKKSTELS